MLSQAEKEKQAERKEKERKEKERKEKEREREKEREKEAKQAEKDAAEGKVESEKEREAKVKAKEQEEKERKEQEEKEKAREKEEHSKEKMAAIAQAEFSFGHVLRVISMCQQLLVEVVEKLKKNLPASPKASPSTFLASPGVNPISSIFPSLVNKTFSLVDLSHISLRLRGSVGGLLCPLLASLWGMKLDLSRACHLLPYLSRLLRVVDSLAALMPDVQAEESLFIKGKTQVLLLVHHYTTFCNSFFL